MADEVNETAKGLAATGLSTETALAVAKQAQKLDSEARGNAERWNESLAQENARLAGEMGYSTTELMAGGKTVAQIISEVDAAQIDADARQKNDRAAKEARQAEALGAKLQSGWRPGTHADVIEAFGLVP